MGKRIAPDTDILALLPVQERDPVLQQAFAHMVDSAQQRLIVLVGADDWVEAGRAADIYHAVLAPTLTCCNWTIVLWSKHRRIGWHHSSSIDSPC